MADALDDDMAEGVWLSISDLAREKGVDKAAISRRVAELEGEGLISTRPGPGKSKLVNLAQYDLVVGETTDLARERTAETVQANREFGGDMRRREADVKKAQYEAALKSIELGKAVGSLVEIKRVAEVIAEVGEELKKPLEQIPLRTDDIVAAALNGGATAVRGLLMEIIFDLRTKFTEALRKLDIRPKGTGAP